jgi:ribose-phosphate pyrophosphokinase
VFAEEALETLGGSQIERLIATNSIEHPRPVVSPKVEFVSIAPLFGEAIRRLHQRESISMLFS